MKTFVISQRFSQRKPFVKKELEKINLNFKFSYAIPNKKIEQLFKNIKYKKIHNKNMSIGEVSCLLNHLKCIYYIYKKNFKDKNYLILEDDIIFDESYISFCNFLNYVENLDLEYDALKIGYPLMDKKDMHILNSEEMYTNNDEKALFSGFLFNVPVLSNQAYILSYSGINKIGKYLEKCLKKEAYLLIDPADWWMIALERGFLHGLDFRIKSFTYHKNLIIHKEGPSTRENNNKIFI